MCGAWPVLLEPSTQRSAQRLLACMAVSICVSLLAGCASPAAFDLNNLAPPDADWGDVLLYRVDAQRAAQENFDVTLDGLSVATLPNASVLWLRLRPGTHRLGVEPGAARRRSELSIWVEAGRRHFFHYDFATRTTVSDAFVGSSIRSASVADGESAVAPLQLLGMPCGPTCPPGPIVIRSRAAIDDVDAVPTLNAKGRAGYRAWLRQAPPRAFVLAGDGQWHACWGRLSAERALQQCREGGHSACQLYAVDHRVVWDRP